MSKFGRVLAQPRVAVLFGRTSRPRTDSVKGGKFHEPPNLPLKLARGCSVARRAVARLECRDAVRRGTGDRKPRAA